MANLLIDDVIMAYLLKVEPGDLLVEKFAEMYVSRISEVYAKLAIEELLSQSIESMIIEALKGRNFEIPDEYYDDPKYSAAIAILESEEFREKLNEKVNEYNSKVYDLYLPRLNQEERDQVNTYIHQINASNEEETEKTKKIMLEELEKLKTQYLREVNELNDSTPSQVVGTLTTESDNPANSIQLPNVN